MAAAPGFLATSSSYEPRTSFLSPNTITHKNTNGGFLTFSRRSLAFSRINAVVKKWDPSKVVPQADRVLVRLEQLPEKSSGGVLLPKSAVKFERYLMGEVLSVGGRSPMLKLGRRFSSQTLMHMSPDFFMDADDCSPVASRFAFLIGLNSLV